MTGLRSGEVAHAAGVNQQTLRYYERRGLLAEPLRTPGGHRLYPAEAVTVVRVIKAAQRLGFSLGEVAELIETGLPRPGSRRHGASRHGASRHGASQHGASQHGGRPGLGLRQRAAAKLAAVEAKIADLTLIADTLRAALDAGCDDLIDCAHEPRCPIPFASLADPDVR